MSKNNFWYNIEYSGILTFIGIVLLFSGAVIVTLIAPNFIDSTWTQPTTPYQTQMYEVSDPNYYITSSPITANDLQAVYHLHDGFTLLAFQETETVRILAPKDLEKYVTRFKHSPLKLTSRLLMLQPVSQERLKDKEQLIDELQKEWATNHPNTISPAFSILELIDPKKKDAFALASTGGVVLENWVDEDFVILEGTDGQEYHSDKGVIFVNNPVEYRVHRYEMYGKRGWMYDPEGEVIATLDDLKSCDMGFKSRKELIQLGELIYAHEGCWYCHTDQTRTLVQDVVLNGSDSFPAPPSSPNEYIYDRVTFPGTHRIGPDLSREGIKKPSRDWHRAHFWSPKTASIGSIMPSFQHFFDDDPRGTAKNTMGIPNYKFEAIFQYLMTKGTRITPPNQGWWIGKDPINTKEIIEGERRL